MPKKQKVGLCWSHHNGNHEYRDENGYMALIRNGKNLFEGLKAILCQKKTSFNPWSCPEEQKSSLCWSYTNGDHEYRDENGYMVLMRNGKNLLEGLKAILCWTHPNGDYEYLTEDWHIHHVRIDNKNKSEKS